MGAKMGRPKLDNPKIETIKIRATTQDKEMLLQCCEKLGCTQYELIMGKIKEVYNELKEK